MTVTRLDETDKHCIFCLGDSLFALPATCLLEVAANPGVSADLPAAEDDHIYLRATPRGQNLDRAGVSAKHLKLLQGLNERCSACQLAVKFQGSADEVRRVLRAFELADLVERHAKSAARQILVFDTDPASAGRWREKLDSGQRYYGKVVRDEFAMKLVLKRAEPAAFVFAITNAEVLASLCELRQSCGEVFADAKWIGLFPPDVDRQQVIEHLATRRDHGRTSRVANSSARCAFGRRQSSS